MEKLSKVIVELMFAGLVIAEFFIFSSLGNFAGTFHPVLGTVSWISFFVAAVLTVKFLLRKFGGITFQQIGLNAGNLGKNILQGAAVALILLIPILLISWMIFGNKFQFTNQLNPGSLVNTFITCLFIGFWEELLCRGYILVILLRNRVSFAVSLLVSAAIFGGLHSFGLDEYDSALWPVSAFAIGCILGIIYQQTGSLIIPIVYHITWDFLGSILFQKEIGLFAVQDLADFNSRFQNMVLFFLLALVPVAWILFRRRKLSEQLASGFTE